MNDIASLQNFHRLTALLLLLFCHACQGQKLTGTSNVSYGKAAGEDLLLDVLGPAKSSTKPRPAVLLIHGGAWSAGDKTECLDLANDLAGRGYVTFSINYRLVTAHTNKWPAQLDDCQRALRWVRANAKRYGVDPSKVGVWGGSAGGHLAACMGTMETRDNSDPALSSYSSRPTCVIDMAGPTDLAENLAPRIKQGEWTNEQIRILMGGTSSELPEEYRMASPLFHVDGKSAPTLLFHGAKDDVVPVGQAERFYAALKKEGVETILIVFPAEGHGFESLWSLLKFQSNTHSFLKKHLPL